METAFSKTRDFGSRLGSLHNKKERWLWRLHGVDYISSKRLYKKDARNDLGLGAEDVYLGCSARSQQCIYRARVRKGRKRMVSVVVLIRQSCMATPRVWHDRTSRHRRERIVINAARGIYEGSMLWRLKRPSRYASEGHRRCFSRYEFGINPAFTPENAGCL